MDSIDPRPARRTVLKVAAAGAVLTPILAACGSGSSGSGSQATRKLTAVRKVSDIEAAARKEGKLTVYAVGAPWLTPVQKAFQKSYPWLKVNMYVNDPASVQSKVITEHNTHTVTADVVQVLGGGRAAYKSAGALAECYVPNQQKLSADYRDDPVYHAIYQVIQVLAYNDKLVPSPPLDPFVLADPSWKGKISMDQPQNLGASATFLASRRALWGDDKWTTWLKGLKANDILLASTAGDAYNNVLNGERSIGPNALADILDQPAGAPVKADFFSELVVYPQWFCLTALAAHPNAAILWMNYVESVAGQKLIAASGAVPVMDLDVPVAVANTVPKDVQVLSVSKLTAFWDNSPQYLKIFNQYWPS